MPAANRRQDAQAASPESQPGVQGQGGDGCRGGETTLVGLAQQYDVHPNLINQWRSRLLEGAADVFVAEPTPGEPAVDVTVLYARIGELTLANDFFGRCAREGRSVAKRKAMIDRGHALPLTDHARHLGISRDSI